MRYQGIDLTPENIGNYKGIRGVVLDYDTESGRFGITDEKGDSYRGNFYERGYWLYDFLAFSPELFRRIFWIFPEHPKEINEIDESFGLENNKISWEIARCGMGYCQLYRSDYDLVADFLIENPEMRKRVAEEAMLKGKITESEFHEIDSYGYTFDDIFLEYDIWADQSLETVKEIRKLVGVNEEDVSEYDEDLDDYVRTLSPLL